MLTGQEASQVKLVHLGNGVAEVHAVLQDHQVLLVNQGFLVFVGFLALMGLLVPRDKWATGERVGPQVPKGRQEISEDQDLQGFRVLEVPLEELESRV